MHEHYAKVVKYINVSSFTYLFINSLIYVFIYRTKRQPSHAHIMPTSTAIMQHWFFCQFQKGKYYAIEILHTEISLHKFFSGHERIVREKTYSQIIGRQSDALFFAMLVLFYNEPTLCDIRTFLSYTLYSASDNLCCSRIYECWFRNDIFTD